MLAQHPQRHFADAPFVEQQLAFILRKEGLRQLPQGGRAPGIDRRPDKQRLVDLAHAHALQRQFNLQLVVGGEDLFSRSFCDQGHTRKKLAASSLCTVGLQLLR